jgi:hypothetical protein
MSPDEMLYDQLSTFITRFANLRASLEDGNVDADATLTSLLHFDSELASWESSLPPSWACRAVPCGPDDKFYGTVYYVYPSYWNATVWGEYCAIRILVSDLLLTYLDQAISFSIDGDSTKYRTYHCNTLRTLQKVCTDVCASAPYFLGRVNESPMLNLSLGGYHVLYSLLVCACVSQIPDSQRLWATNQLESIGRDMGIHLAFLLSDLMRNKAYLTHHGHNSAKLVENLAWYEHIRKGIFTREGFMQR